MQDRAQTSKFPAVLAAALVALAAHARTEYTVGDLYAVADDGSRRPIAARFVKAGRAHVPSNAPHYIELEGIEPGDYYLAIDAGIPKADGRFVRDVRVYVNGRRCQAYRACVPEEGNGAQWFSFEKQPLKSGDVVAFLGPGTSLTRLRVLKDRLADDVVPCVNE